MDRIAALIDKYLAQEMSVARFLERLELEKERVWLDLNNWWKSAAAFQTVWNDLGGFDEVEYERRVSDAFSFDYSRVIRKALDPILRRNTSDFPEMGMVIRKVEPFLLSDINERLRAAETVDEAYFLLGDDLTHWLVVYLVDHLRVPQSHV